MTIQGISGAPTTSLTQVGSTSSVAQTSAGAVDADGDHDGGSTAQVSEGAQFLSKIQDLEQSDPAKAKEVLTGLATKVRDQAQQGGGDAHKLGALADKLDKAAKTGDLSGLAKSKRRKLPRPGGQVQHAYAHQAQAPGKDLLSMLNTQIKSVGSSAGSPAASTTTSASTTSASTTSTKTSVTA